MLVYRNLFMRVKNRCIKLRFLLSFSLYERFTPYLLHGDLWLGGHVLLGVAHSGSILVLGHGSYWSSGSG